MQHVHGRQSPKARSVRLCQAGIKAGIRYNRQSQAKRRVHACRHGTSPVTALSGTAVQHGRRCMCTIAHMCARQHMAAGATARHAQAAPAACSASQAVPRACSTPGGYPGRVITPGSSWPSWPAAGSVLTAPAHRCALSAYARCHLRSGCTCLVELRRGCACFVEHASLRLPCLSMLS